MRKGRSYERGDPTIVCDKNDCYNLENVFKKQQRTVTVASSKLINTCNCVIKINRPNIISNADKGSFENPFFYILYLKFSSELRSFNALSKIVGQKFFFDSFPYCVIRKSGVAG